MPSAATSRSLLAWYSHSMPVRMGRIESCDMAKLTCFSMLFNCSWGRVITVKPSISGISGKNDAAIPTSSMSEKPLQSLSTCRPSATCILTSSLGNLLAASLNRRPGTTIDPGTITSALIWAEIASSKSFAVRIKESFSAIILTLDEDSPNLELVALATSVAAATKSSLRITIFTGILRSK